MTKPKSACTHSQAYHLICTLPPYLQKKMPTPADLLFINARTFSAFMQKVIRLGSCHKDILYHCIDSCEALIELEGGGDKQLNMQYVVRKVVNPRLSNSSIIEKKEMRSIVYSLFGMRARIKEGWKDARIVTIK